MACSVAITVSHSCSRSNAGHTDAAARTAQITTLGYRGSDKTVRRYRQPFRETLTASPPVPIAPHRPGHRLADPQPHRLTEDYRPRLNWDSHAYANGERSLLQLVPAAGRMPENK